MWIAGEERGKTSRTGERNIGNWERDRNVDSSKRKRNMGRTAEGNIENMKKKQENARDRDV